MHSKAAERVSAWEEEVPTVAGALERLRQDLARERQLRVAVETQLAETRRELAAARTALHHRDAAEAQLAETRRELAVTRADLAQRNLPPPPPLPPYSSPTLSPEKPNVTRATLHCASMSLEQAVHVLHTAGLTNSRIASAACSRAKVLTRGAATNKLDAWDIGLLEAVLLVMRAHPMTSAVQEQACLAINNMLLGLGGVSIKDRAIDEGVLDEAISAMRAVPKPSLQEYALAMLVSFTHFADAIDVERERRICQSLSETTIAAGGLSQTLHALRYYMGTERVAEMACKLLGNLCHCNSDAKHAAVEAGGVPLLVAAMHTHSTCAAVQAAACRAIKNVCTETRSMEGQHRVVDAIQAGALEAVRAARCAHLSNADVQAMADAAEWNLTREESGLSLRALGVMLT